MRNDGRKDGLHIVGENMLAPLQKGAGLTGPLQSESSSGGKNPTSCLARFKKIQNVVRDRIGNMKLASLFLPGDEIVWRGESGQTLEIEKESIAASAIAFEKLPLGRAGGRAERNAHEEAIDLRFGKSCGSHLLVRVLGPDKKERIGKWVGMSFDGHFMFVHGLQDRALSARRGPVEFISQNQLRENRSPVECEGLLRGIKDLAAQNVAGKKIVGELDAFEVEAQQSGEDFDQSGFADAGEVFDEKVSTGDETAEGEFQFLLSINEGTTSFGVKFL